MPALRLIPPAVLKDILLKYAYEVVDKDAFVWVLRRGDELPLILTRRGPVVVREIMEKALDQAKMDNATYFRFLKEVAPNLASDMSVEQKP